MFYVLKRISPNLELCVTYAKYSMRLTIPIFQSLSPHASPLSAKDAGTDNVETY